MCKEKPDRLSNVIKIRRGAKNQGREQVIEKIARSFFV